MPTKEYLQELRRSKRELPPMREIAARLRDGENHAALAHEFGLVPNGLAARLTSAGYRYDTGEVERDAQLREMKQHLKSKLLTYQEPWMADAVCSQTDPDAFFPEKGGSTAEAKKVCLSCPVRTECLEYALSHNERYGIFGGKSERERRKLAKGRAA